MEQASTRLGETPCTTHFAATRSKVARSLRLSSASIASAVNIILARRDASRYPSTSGYFFCATPNSLSLSAMSEPCDPVFTAVSMNRIFPSLPM